MCLICWDRLRSLRYPQWLLHLPKFTSGWFPVFSFSVSLLPAHLAAETRLIYTSLPSHRKMKLWCWRPASLGVHFNPSYCVNAFTSTLLRVPYHVRISLPFNGGKFLQVNRLGVEGDKFCQCPHCRMFTCVIKIQPGGPGAFPL